MPSFPWMISYYLKTLTLPYPLLQAPAHVPAQVLQNSLLTRCNLKSWKLISLLCSQFQPITWTWATSIPWQQRWPTASRASSAGAQPAGRGTGDPLLLIHTAASLGPPNTGKTQINCGEFVDGQGWSSALEESLGQVVSPVWRSGGFGDTSQTAQFLWEGHQVDESQTLQCGVQWEAETIRVNVIFSEIPPFLSIQNSLKPVDSLHWLKKQYVMPTCHNLFRLTVFYFWGFKSLGVQFWTGFHLTMTCNSPLRFHFPDNICTSLKFMAKDKTLTPEDIFG